MNHIIAGLIITLLPCAALAQKPSTATDQVPIEEYVPKVIIEGKWGTGPGEFGAYDEPWNGTAYSPSSLAVDSESNIYVLDYVNNRIQKFNSAGEFLKIIPVEGFSGNRRNEEVSFFVDRDNPDVNVPPDHPRKIEIKKRAEIIEPDFKTIGINIVIDSKDDLYYYLKRTKDGKESGEVWQFRDDKLVKKTKVPSHAGVLDEREGELWITEYPMSQVNTDIGEDYSVSDKKKHSRKDLRPKMRASAAVLKINARQEKAVHVAINDTPVVLMAQKNGRFLDDAAAAERRVSNKIRIDDNGHIMVVSEENSEPWTNYYTKTGKLVKKFRWSSRPPVFGGFRDRDKNIYLPEANAGGFKVIKYELRVVK